MKLTRQLSDPRIKILSFKIPLIFWLGCRFPWVSGISQKHGWHDCSFVKKWSRYIHKKKYCTDLLRFHLNISSTSFPTIVWPLLNNFCGIVYLYEKCAFFFHVINYNSATLIVHKLSFWLFKKLRFQRKYSFHWRWKNKKNEVWVSQDNIFFMYVTWPLFDEWAIVSSMFLAIPWNPRESAPKPKNQGYFKTQNFNPEIRKLSD